MKQRTVVLCVETGARYKNAREAADATITATGHAVAQAGAILMAIANADSMAFGFHWKRVPDERCAITNAELINNI